MCGRLGVTPPNAHSRIAGGDHPFDTATRGGRAAPGGGGGRSPTKSIVAMIAALQAHYSPNLPSQPG